VLAALLAILSVIAVWTRNQVLDIDRYVETVAPLAREPSIQDVPIDRLTDAIAAPDRTTEFVRRLLPPRADPLATTVERAVEGSARGVRELGTQVDAGLGGGPAATPS
jgi:hypothetical protein